MLNKHKQTSERAPGRKPKELKVLGKPSTPNPNCDFAIKIAAPYVPTPRKLGPSFFYLKDLISFCFDYRLRVEIG